jgi:WD40 repeat protein
LQTRPFDTGTCLPLAVTFIRANAATKAPSRMLAACTDNTLRMIAPAGNTLATMTGHTDWVYAVAASPNGERIASGGGDGSIRIWGPAGKLTATLAEEAK